MRRIRRARHSSGSRASAVGATPGCAGTWWPFLRLVRLVGCSLLRGDSFRARLLPSTDASWRSRFIRRRQHIQRGRYQPYYGVTSESGFFFELWEKLTVPRQQVGNVDFEPTRDDAWRVVVLGDVHAALHHAGHRCVIVVVGGGERGGAPHTRRSYGVGRGNKTTRRHLLQHGPNSSKG